MKPLISIALLVAIAAGSASLPRIAYAQAGLFVSEEQAQGACKADEVVWVDLDRGRYYHKAQSAYGKGSNGGYGCAKAAHAQYRESHD
jgi:hypothetical protein